jgi:hypothetical protein
MFASLVASNRRRDKDVAAHREGTNEYYFQVKGEITGCCSSLDGVVIFCLAH